MGKIQKRKGEWKTLKKVSPEKFKNKLDKMEQRVKDTYGTQLDICVHRGMNFRIKKTDPLWVEQARLDIYMELELRVSR
jgi:hypothetical protein